MRILASLTCPSSSKPRRELSNALKFTPRGGRVTLSATAAIEGGLAIAVRDTGIGIAHEHIPTVLAPFGQIESVASRQHHGTGLGLPLTKSLIELHGGKLAIDSTPGTGTVVTLHLPRERVHWQPRLATTTIRAMG
ncbi:MAG TPA: ATP-binding protein [Stellaceae bacterium]|nr:ATP-binding protein [Stellaceae bacterium]